MYGENQHPRSIISQLEKAIYEGKSCFEMSFGEQLLDYLPVEDVARQLVDVAQYSDLGGIYHISKGSPIALRRFIEGYIREKFPMQTIELNLGVFSYRKTDSIGIWGNEAGISKCEWPSYFT
jgi:dTDP-6-deoxy-L-talose 4-dehydrogenase (NAD+)